MTPRLVRVALNGVCMPDGSPAFIDVPILPHETEEDAVDRVRGIAADVTANIARPTVDRIGEAPIPCAETAPCFACARCMATLTKVLQTDPAVRIHMTGIETRASWKEARNTPEVKSLAEERDIR